jgi:curved DNA-binding protein CbpA
MNGMPDPYVLLGISPGADARTVKRAYRRLAKRFHPDLNPGDPQAGQHFKQIQWAYETVMACRGDGKGDARACHTDSRAGFPIAADEHPFFGFYAAMQAYWRQNKP